MSVIKQDEPESICIEFEVKKSFTPDEFRTGYLDWLSSEKSKALTSIQSMDYVASASMMACDDDDFCVKPTDTGFDCEAEFCFTVQYRGGAV